jgi:hypothetical protein
VPPLCISASLAGLTLIVWPFAAVVRRLRHRPVVRNRADVISFVLVRAVLGVDVLVLGALIACLKVGPDHITDTADPWLTTVYVFAWLGVFGALFSTWVATHFWRDRVGGLWLRIHHTGLAGASLVMAWFFVHWHVAGTTLKF